MLDFSVSEIGLIGVVALVAIGPERLPKVARAAGVMFGRFRRYAISVKAEIDREIEQSELRELRRKMNEAAREAEQQVTASAQEAQHFLDSPAVPAAEPAQSASAEPAAAAPSLQSSSAQVAAAAPAQAELAFQLPEAAVVPFGGDPFSVRPSGPRRSKPMAAASAPGGLDGGPEPEAT